MLLDVWEWFLLINDGIDLVLSNLASGTYPIPFSFLLVVIFFGLVSFFAWKSTDIPDLPPAPRPPYVIQIVAGPAATGSSRQTISDVRLLSGGFFDGHELLNRYRNLARNQATNTDRNPQPGTSSGEAGVNVEVRRFNAPNANTTRGIPGRSFLLSLFGRPDALIRQRPAGIANALRAQLTSTPNVVVYHRVNVYHHHIHSHPANPGSSSNIQPQNSSPSQQQVESESVASQQVPGGTSSSPSGSGSSVPQDQSSPPPETAATTPESDSSSTPEASPNQLGCNDPASPTDGVIHDQINDAFDSSGVSSEDVDPDLDSILSLSAPDSAVQFVENLDSNPTASTSGVQKSMPAESSSRSGDGEGNLSQQKPSSTSTSTSSSTAGGGAGGGDDVRFIIKFLNDTQMDVTSQLSEKIVDFKRRHFATEMSENKTVRLIFNGRVLDQDTKTLREFGIFDQCVVHCLIVNRQQHQDQSRSSNASASGRGNNGGGDPMQENMRRVGGLPEPGMFFIAFIGIFLIFLWFICLHFGQHLFTQSAVVSLTVLTAIFLIGIVACYLPLPVN